MAIIRQVPPEPPRWQFCINEDERQYLLAAFDFARRYIGANRTTFVPDNQWPLSREHYAQMIGFLEQVVASANPADLRNV